MAIDPNPQGKGLIPVLSVLAEGQSAALHVPPKEIEQISVELFTSLFVLESDFKFKPVVGQSYWLYQKSGRFFLSLVAPGQWDESAYGRFIGGCMLQRDMTWTLELAGEISEDDEVLEYIREKRRGLDERIRSAEVLEDILPGYNESLPFYQRAFNHALAHSLRTSMRRAGIDALPFSEARLQLEERESGEEVPEEVQEEVP